MAEPPPPAQPPAGWYPDPDGGPGHRWWDGSAWSDHHAPDGVGDLPPAPGREAEALPPFPGGAGAVPPAGGAVPPSAGGSGVLPPPPGAAPAAGSGAPFGPIGEWLSESFRLAIGRAGHLLPLILFGVLTTSVAVSVAVFYGLEGTVVEISESGAATVDYDGSVPAVYAAVGFLLLSMVLVPLLKASVAYQVLAVRAETPEAWSDSLRRALGRAGRIVGASLGRTALYWILLVAAFIAIGAVPALILLFPLVIGLLVLAWYRLSMVGVSAALGPEDERPFRKSWELTAIATGPTLGRLLLLAVVAFNLILAANFLLAPLILLVGSEAPADTGSDTLILKDQLGPTAALAALRAFVNGFGLGANYVLAAAGTTLLYLRLGGSVSIPDPAPSTDPALDDPLAGR